MARTIKQGKITRYTATGRRKTAVARVYLQAGKGSFLINGKIPELHLGNVPSYLTLIKKPLEALKLEDKYDIVAKVHGGGLSGQADAIRLGIARALVEANEASNKQTLKSGGLLTRDPRAKERKKYGRKKARKRFQHSKR